MNPMNYAGASLRLDDLISTGTSTVSALFDLIADTTAKIENAGSSDTFLLQSGTLADGKHASDASGYIVDHTPGVHDVGSTDMARLLDSIKFQTALRDAIAREQFGLNDYNSGSDIQKVSVRESFSLYRDGLDANGQRVKAGDGKTLLDSQVQNLVQAMAGFSPPASGETTLPANYQSSLNTVIAANWQ